MRRFDVTHAALIVCLGAAGCHRGEIVAGVSDSSFVRAMAELRRVNSDAALDSAAKASARAAVLQREGLTPAQLERAATALADDPGRAGAVFAAIDSAASRADSMRRAPSVAKPSEPAATPAHAPAPPRTPPPKSRP